jgi:hypothetical protein
MARFRPTLAGEVPKVGISYGNYLPPQKRIWNSTSGAHLQAKSALYFTTILFGGHYTKKFELISSRTPNEARAERVVTLNKIVRSDNRPATASRTRQPRKKNTPCISDLAGVKFLLKKERVFFFRGSALQVFGQCGGAKCGLGFAKTISGEKDLAKPRLIFVFCICPRGGGVWGGIRAGFKNLFSAS